MEKAMGVQLLFTVLLVSLSNLTTATEYDELFNHTQDGDDPTSPEEYIKTKERTEKPISTYEVTENVIDIPNNETFLGPILANFTLTRPLNNATTDTDLNNNNETNKPKGNYLSIVHVKAEYDGNIAQNVNYQYPNFPGIRDYIYGVRKGLAHGVNSVVNNHIHNDVNRGIHVPNIVAHPVLFLNRLHRKSIDVASKVHKSIFGHAFDGER